jgi:hypothetical protein
VASDWALATLSKSYHLVSDRTERMRLSTEALGDEDSFVYLRRVKGCSSGVEHLACIESQRATPKVGSYIEERIKKVEPTIYSVNLHRRLNQLNRIGSSIWSRNTSISCASAILSFIG